MSYFIGASGRRYDYADLAKLIREQAPETLGKHISIQLKAIGLLDEMEGGETPCGLPFSFAYEQVQKRLASSGMFNTPGFFRALQNDYRIRGEPRTRAIKLLSEGYALPPDEAEGLLSGAIAIEIDESAGTVTYFVNQ